MSSCDDDFPLLPPPSSSATASAATLRHRPTLPLPSLHHVLHHHQPPPDDDADYPDDDYRRAFEAPCTFNDDDKVSDHEAKSVVKRRDRDDLSDGGKRPRSAPSAASDYRKDREEWSDSAIGCLLDAYTDKYFQLNRGNLRGRDWEDVATIVSERSDKQKSCKSVEQCKNKVDNLKKRYKAERQRLSSGSLSVSHWPWFKKMEQIVGFSSPSSSAKLVVEEEKVVVVGGGNAGVAVKQQKRCTSATAGTSGSSPNIKMKSLSNPRWRRVLFKISGATFSGENPQSIDPKITMMIAKEIAVANHRGVEVAIVVGGGNFLCGDAWAATASIDITAAYQIGMMATVMNSILLQACLEKIGVQSRVQTAFVMQEIAEPYVRRRAIRHLEKARVVIFGGVCNGTGCSLIGSDTAAVLRASEINADVVFKGTNGDNAYDCHSGNNNATIFEHISFKDYAARSFQEMDVAATNFCEENNIPVVLFNLFGPGNISRALCGEQVGTLIDQSGAVS